MKIIEVILDPVAQDPDNEYEKLRWTCARAGGLKFIFFIVFLASCGVEAVLWRIFWFRWGNWGCFGFYRHKNA